MAGAAGTLSGRFVALWVPQTLSMSARGLTTFGLGVWIFEKTHSATLYTLLSVAALLPGLASAPFLGVLADRLGPKRSLLLADGGGILVGALVALAFALEVASPYLLYALLTIDALLIALHFPAYTALVTAVTPHKELPRASALMQLGYAGQGVIAPALGGLALRFVGVGALVAIDVVTTTVAFASLALIRPPPASPSRTNAWRELQIAMALIREHGLFRLAGYILATYLPGGWVLALATPFVLSVATPQTLGVVLSVMGAGMVLGSLVASTLARPGNGVRRMLGYDTLLVTAMLCAGLTASAHSIAALGFVFLFGLAGLMAEEQALWQTRIPVDAQGRVFALRRMITWASLPLSYGLAGVLADHLFEPAMAEGGPLAPLLGPLIGEGPGRGIALLLTCGGLLKGSVVVWGHFDAKLRTLDRREA